MTGLGRRITPASELRWAASQQASLTTASTRHTTDMRGRAADSTKLDIMWLIGIFVTWAVTRTPDYGPLPALIAQTSCE
ncbi:hypothetical protein A5752_22295 [Mycobacterium sp. 852002-51961_SCH5331710]|nr:hypothetical protein A5752_22295 [Mycobacterium sp. 852002-51961_SCH5331710]